MAKLGLSFSGGGTRSAAFCSGVLRRLLQKNVNVDYLSCVSGGGFTGTAYLDWKYRHEKKDNKKWHLEFFDHMREGVGLICHCQRPCQAVLESLALIAILSFVTLLAPILLWGPYAFLLAYIIDFLFGSIMRGGDLPCPDEVRRNPNITIEECEHARRTSDFSYHRFALFAIPVCISFISYVIKSFVQKKRGYFNFLTTFGLMSFALVFIPWFINEFLLFVPTFMKILVIVPFFLVWISFPAMRTNATLMTVCYCYSFVIQIRIYHNNSLGIDYDDKLFSLLLALSAIVIWTSPLISTIQQRLGHVYVRWTIQKAFYYPKSVGTCGCSGISWSDLFLFWPTFGCFGKTNIQAVDRSVALTLDDLDDITPTYIGCMTVNRWRRTPSPREAHYEVLTMSPHVIERLDRAPEDEEFHGKLMPMDVYLSAAAATSAAMLDHDSGRIVDDEAQFRDLKAMLGLSLGASVVADKRHEEKRHFCVQILPPLIELIRVIPLVIAVGIFIMTGQDEYLPIGILIFFGISVLLAFIALVPTGGRDVGRLEQLARWFTINMSFIQFHRKIMQVTNVGPNPPPVLSLSDGGHIENLGILPLLKLRLKKIIAVDGGRTLSDLDYGQELLLALDLAREKLGCSFSGMGGRDIAEDIRDKFVERSPGSQPRSYRFKVYYYDKNHDSDRKTKVGEGEVLYITPRHPDKAVKTLNYVTWEKALRDIDVNLEAGLWGTGPELSAEEADRLTFCCCECCHGNACRGLSEAICGSFPHHSTNNQFLTPTMFSAYHREGYRASMEAKVADFVSEKPAIPGTPVILVV